MEKQIDSEIFFKPEDFNSYVDAEGLANIANEKLNMLIESWPKAYGKEGFWDIERKSKHTFQCRLAFIEEIKKECVNHEPDHLKTWQNVDGTKIYFCKHCGVELQAIWQEKK